MSDVGVGLVPAYAVDGLAVGSSILNSSGSAVCSTVVCAVDRNNAVGDQSVGKFLSLGIVAVGVLSLTKSEVCAFEYGSEALITVLAGFNTGLSINDADCAVFHTGFIEDFLHVFAGLDAACIVICSICGSSRNCSCSVNIDDLDACIDRFFQSLVAGSSIICGNDDVVCAVSDSCFDLLDLLSIVLGLRSKPVQIDLRAGVIVCFYSLFCGIFKANPVNVHLVHRDQRHFGIYACAFGSVKVISSKCACRSHNKHCSSSQCENSLFHG